MTGLHSRHRSVGIPTRGRAGFVWGIEKGFNHVSDNHVLWVQVKWKRLQYWSPGPSFYSSWPGQACAAHVTKTYPSGTKCLSVLAVLLSLSVFKMPLPSLETSTFHFYGILVFFLNKKNQVNNLLVIFYYCFDVKK